MLNISFLLKEPSSKDKTLIYMFVFLGTKKPLKYSVSEKVHPDFWNKKQQRVRVVRECSDAKAINEKLDRYERVLKQIYLDLENEGVAVTPEILKHGLDVSLGKVEHRDVVNNDFIMFYKEYVDKRVVSEGCAAKSFKTGINTIIKFVGDKKITFDDIDYLFYEQFVDFMKTKGFSNNYIGSHIKMMKTVLNYATKIGRNKNMKFRNFEKLREDINNIYLTDDEVQLIYDLKLSGYLDRARDLFIIGCCTAMRFSDFTQIRPENIVDGFIHYTSQKTSETCVIPVHWMIYELLDKYDGNLPKSISNQKLNDYLKEIGKLAELNDSVTRVRTEGGHRVRHVFKKYELITTHTARRSAATNMYKKGIPTIGLMKITGHKTESSFMTYIKISKEESAKMMAENSFFHKPTKGE